MSSSADQSAFAYSDWAIAFLDIVGFKDLVARTKDSTPLISDIAGTLLNAHERLRGLEAAVKEIETQTFSDTTLICCCEPEPIALVSLMSVISRIQCDMTLRGYLFRGGLAVGPNFRSGNTMFGPAIIEAYEMEPLGEWPRVLVAPSVLERLNRWVSEWPTYPYVIVDDHGLVYVDYLMEGCLLTTADQWAKEYKGRIATTQPSNMEVLLSCHRDATMSLREKANDSVRKLSKCHSLAKYHNGTIERLNALLSHWEPDVGVLSQERHLNYLGVQFLGGMILGAEIQLPTSWKEAAKAFDWPEEYHKARIAHLNVWEQANRDFTRSRLIEMRATQDRLNQLLIDLPSSFPALYGKRSAA